MMWRTRNHVGNLHRSESSLLQATIYICFFLSGASGLLYEIIWIRMLGLVFGHTVYAVTTVLTAFMAGLALGAYLFGRLIDRGGRPLWVYGLLEAAIGLYALLVPFLLDQVRLVYLALYRGLHLSFFTFSLAQFVLVFLVLLVPTTLMGATLPVLSKFFVQRVEGVGRKVGDLYALNTFGAVVGTAAAGFFLLPAIGVWWSIVLGAGLNLVIAAAALGIDRGLAKPVSPHLELPRERVEVRPEDEAAPLTRPLLVLFLCGIGLSGAASMVYEIAWTRALVLVIGSSTYAFSAMLTTFLVGLALGSFLFARIWGRSAIDASLFGFLEMGIGLVALAVVPAFDRMPDLVLAIFKQISPSAGGAVLTQFVLSFLIMIVPTILIGAAFPCVVRLATTQLRRLGREVGTVYSANTVGTVVGVFAAGFIVVPTLGVQSSIVIAAALNAVLGATVLVICDKHRWRQWAAVSLLAVFAVGCMVFPKWNREVMISGAPLYAPNYVNKPDPGGSFRADASGIRLLFYEEGITSTVSVEQTAWSTALRVNGKIDASDGIDMATQLMSGHLPMLLHSQPERALIIGLGSGVTAGAMVQHPVLQALDVVELEPAVIRASAFFTHVNRDVLQDPRVREVVADGRNFILASEAKYDVIVSEPSNPWIAGVANLFSREYYELVRTRLAQDGIMVQWVQGYSLFPREMKMIVNTFRTVFPHTTVWWTMLGDYLLVGTNQRLVIDFDKVRARYDASPEIQEDFKVAGWKSPLALLTFFLLNEEDTAGYARGALENTDDRPLLEFSAPLALYANTIHENHRRLRAARTRGLPPIVGLDERSLWTASHRLQFARAVRVRGDGQTALEQLREMDLSGPGDESFLLERAKLLFGLGMIGEAMEDLSRLSKMRSDRPLIESYLRVGRLLRAHRLERTLLAYGTANQKSPNPARAHNKLGLYYRSLGTKMREPALFDLAVDAFQAALQLQAEDYWVINNLANAYLEQGLLAQAEAAYLRTIHIKPDFAEAHSNLGLLYERQGALDLAAREYQTALKLRPDWGHLRLGLQRIDAASRRKE
jgi:spermidine synthase